jgi:hypothetical protein
MNRILLFVCAFLSISSFAQESNNKAGEIHGNFEAISQFYNKDDTIGAPQVDEKMLLNSFTNLIYTKGNFNAGARFETYLNPLQGFDLRYEGAGIPYKYINYKVDNIDVTVGNFYEQFGSGMIYRSYEVRSLGVDNAMNGIRVKFNPMKGVYLKAIWGKQRIFWDYGAGIVRGIDGEISLNELIPQLDTIKTRITIGGSFVSKYQEAQSSTLNLPKNVGAYGGRLSINHGRIGFQGEYIYKENDPSADNYFIYKPGQAALLTGSYSKKGLGITVSAKSIDNMSYRSDRGESSNNLMINYMPALTRQHTYNLAATLYPYATQPTGEVAFQGDIIYKIPRKTKLGGKYGTTIAVNYSRAHGLDTTQFHNYRNDGGLIVENANDTLRQGYSNNFLSIGKQRYFEDANIEITRKINKKLKIKGSYIYLVYYTPVINEGNPNKFNQNFKGNITSHIGVVDVLYKLNKKNAVRVEVQHLYTKKDYGNWLTGVIEYTMSPHWFFAVMDQWNYGNGDSNYQFHYPIVSMGYNEGGTRFSFTYGRQRAGIFCVGGVCRNVPAANGLTLSITSRF